MLFLFWGAGEGYFGFFKSQGLLTILVAVFLSVHLLEVQYNAFGDKDNMLFYMYF